MALVGSGKVKPAPYKGEGVSYMGTSHAGKWNQGPGMLSKKQGGMGKNNRLGDQGDVDGKVKSPMKMKAEKQMV